MKWTAPPNPDLEAILDEAYSDFEAGRYEEALDKHVWFHRHALEHDESFCGVRLSFALMEWHELGQVYPPAMQKLREIRDETAKRVLERPDDVFEKFHDLSSINEQLGEERRTVAIFLQLDKEAPEVAKKVYDIAQPALVKAEEFALCGKYLDPEKDYACIAESYRRLQEFTEKYEPAEYKQRLFRADAERNFLRVSATLIALLVLNDRKPEAEKIAEQVSGTFQHRERDAVLRDALAGKLPALQRD